MSLNIPTETLPSQTVSIETTVLNRKTADKCQMVLETLYDSYNGYQQCADNCKDIGLKLLFRNIAACRAEFISQLSDIIKNDLDIEPIQSGSTVAAIHRKWINLKTWFNGGLDKSSINIEIHRGEQILIKFYETVLEDSNLLPKIRDLLQEQLDKVKEQNQSINVV